MNKNAEYIKQRLSLRDPLQEALDVLADITKNIDLGKNVDLEAELALIKAKYPKCTDFEREFPSICYSIATGIGKTRLMGACVAYLHLEKGIKNFFVLAPNITIYEKLIKDFSEPTNPKYVFQGIAEFVHNPPVIITGDNYNQQGAVPGGLIEENAIRINIFNISKFNKESRAGRQGASPRIKRLSEYLGESYWEYLTGLDDLVILMDEAHRYHADASRNAINELKPVLGIEMTATPFDETGVLFKNVVYEYSLAKALSEGKYVKNPAIAKRKNFRPQGLSPLDIERIKLEDAISIHEDTKNELEMFARNNNLKIIKPFILVVCRDINHASDVFKYVSSDAFFGGEYKGKVLQIDSSTKDEEDVELQFVHLDNENNKIEIVIHVNMLKEGWDVTNLYTIAPLRAAQAPVLIEQTIGRGLRLPYGERTGDPKVDKLTVLAHENFEEVIEAAKDPESILNKMSSYEIPESLGMRSHVITAGSVMEEAFKKEEAALQSIPDTEERQVAKNTLDAKKLILEAISKPHIVQQTNGLKDFDSAAIQQKVIADAVSMLEIGKHVQKEAIAAELVKVYADTLAQVRNNTIEIPRMSLIQGNAKVLYQDFDLDTANGFTYKPLSEEILVVEITGEQRRETIGSQQGAMLSANGANLIVAELVKYPEVDYERTSDLLFKLTNQAMTTVERGLEDKSKFSLVTHQYRKVIASKIYDQIQKHVKIVPGEYIEPIVTPFVGIEPWNYVVPTEDGYRKFDDSISPVSLVPKYVYRGFKKACHNEYKFDSNTEKEFAMALEDDKAVEKWLRPAPNQFRIYWSENSKQYQPDFVVETKEAIYLVETKAKDQLLAPDVVGKKQAALQYCKQASAFTAKNGGKSWKYLLIPHDEVSQTSTFEYFVSRFNQ